MNLIKNCKLIIDGTLQNKTIVIENGKIAKITSPSLIKTADEIIEAKGLHAIPGAIDMHVHCREPGMTQKEDFRTASHAAAAGGVTTIIDMPNSNPPTTTKEALDQKRKLAEKCIIDFGFYMGATKDNHTDLKNAKNIAGVKIYMGSSTGSLLLTEEDALKKAFECGKTIMAHCENQNIIEENTNKFIKNPNHQKIRPPEAAIKELQRAISIARQTNARMHACHITLADEADIIAKNKQLMSLSSEVTPHHLLLTDENNPLTKVNPPLRTKKDLAALWQAANNGTIDCIATDHAPHLLYEKQKSYFECPSGVPGVQTMMPLMIDRVNKGMISLPRLIQMTSLNPAKILKIKNKGQIQPGFDADIAIVDMNKKKTIKNEQMKSKCEWTPFDGWKIKGEITKTISRGETVFENGEIISHQGREITYEN